MDYVPLQVKTSYSLLSSLNNIEKLVSLAKNLGYTSLAITDSNMFGTIEFYNKVRAEQYLQDTDYIANKIIEYHVLNKELDNDYTDVLIKREEARQVIRDYEKK